MFVSLQATVARNTVSCSMQGPLSLACLALGAVAAAAPPRLGLAVIGAVGDALSEHYNEQLRQLNEAGAAKEVWWWRRFHWWSGISMITGVVGW